MLFRAANAQGEVVVDTGQGRCCIPTPGRAHLHQDLNGPQASVANNALPPR